MTNMRTFACRIYLLSSSAVTNPFIARDNDPALLPGDHEPFLIARVLSEMIIVDFDIKVCITKNAGHLVAAKLPIQKESQLFFKRLRRG